MVHEIKSDYYRLPLMEYATGAIECVLALGDASHVLLFSKPTPSHGGLYLSYIRVPFGTENVDRFVEQNKLRGAGTFLKLIDLSEDFKEQIKDINEVYLKAVGKEFTTDRPYYW